MDEPEQLGCLKRHGEEQQNIIDPGDRALRLVPVKPEQTKKTVPVTDPIQIRIQIFSLNMHEIFNSY